MKNFEKIIERIDETIVSLSTKDYVKLVENDPSLYLFKTKGGKNIALIVSISKVASMELKNLYEKKTFEAFGDDVNLFETNYATILLLFNVEGLDKGKLKSLVTNIRKPTFN